MTSKPLRAAAFLFATLAVGAAVPSSARAQSTEVPPAYVPSTPSPQPETELGGLVAPSEDQLPLPSVQIDGWSLGAHAFGGVDTNAVDLPEAASSPEVQLGGEGKLGRKMRFSTFDLFGGGSRRWYTGLEGRDVWRAAAGATAGRRLSRNSVGVLAAGYRYDFTDAFLGLPDVATQLPRSTAQGAFVEGQFAFKASRRFTSTNVLRYEGIRFKEPGLLDTRTLRASTVLTRQVSRRDQVGPGYEFLRTDWGTDRTNTHVVYVAWKRPATEGWAFTLESGASRVIKPPLDLNDDVPDVQEPRWLFMGAAGVTLSKGRTAADVSIRRAVSPGYGQGRVLNGTTAQATLSRSVTRTILLRVTGAVDSSYDPFDPTYGTQKGAYLEAEAVARVAGHVGLVASYRYRRRESLEQPLVEGQRFGLALTTAYTSLRRPSRRGREVGR
jgi:hypothetical protein